VNLGRRSVAQKLEHVLKRFSFAPVSAVVASLGEVPEMSATAAR
jgi:hypothetical protein